MMDPQSDRYTIDDVHSVIWMVNSEDSEDGFLDLLDEEWGDDDGDL